MAAADPNNASARLTLAIGLFRLSFPLKLSDPQGAVKSARESVALFDKLIPEGKRSFLVTSRRGRALRRLSEALQFAGQGGEAQAVAAEALVAQRNAAARDAKDVQEATLLAFTLLTNAEAAESLHDPAPALAFLTEAEQIVAQGYLRSPNELTPVIPLARVRDALSLHWHKAGNAAESQRWLNESRRLWRAFPDQNEFVRRKVAEMAL